jgi:uncharacterized protein
VALLYLDSSALVKLYVQEVGTERMLELAHPDTGHRLAILSLARIEFRAAVRRRAKLGDIDSARADELVRDFNVHLASVFQVQPLNDLVLDQAAAVVDRHAIRTYDAIQLGGCLALQASIGDEIEILFVCSDDKLLDVARVEGLQTVNPADPET